MSNKIVQPATYCELCKDFHDFVVPDDLFEALVNHELVIFAGAGISTENKKVFPSTLYEDVLAELGGQSGKRLSFSEAMREYCKKTGSKQELIDRIKTRIDYAKSFPELYRDVTRFHRQLAKIPCIEEIVTTNWDDFFEVECHATPFTYEQDMAFWNKETKKVLKLHGSINNLGSIVVTTEDYENCYKALNEGLIGSQLKLLIANRKLVFIGYSFADEDFNRVYAFVRKQMSDFMRKSYVVTLDKLNDKKWRELGLEPIYTDGEYFLRILVRKLKSKGCFIPVKRMDGVYKELNIMKREHFKLADNINAFVEPEIIYCLSYQDGIIHAFEYLLHHINYGYTLCKGNIVRVMKQHDNLIEEREKSKRWLDVAYIRGYLAGTTFILATDRERKSFPRYLDLSLYNELRTFEEYKNSLSVKVGRVKSISNYASRIKKERIPDDSLVFHHTPLL